jgi:glyoxylase-like metal-dependent hydrolase (beta-lactamase superfamily II)
MKRLPSILVPVLILAGAGPTGAQDPTIQNPPTRNPSVEARYTFPLHILRVSERVLLVWEYDYFQATNMVTLATPEGLVVIDTSVSRNQTRRLRPVVERELGRNDFRYLIATHIHNDHVFGSEVFPEAVFIAHERGHEEMAAEIGRIPELIARLKESRDYYADGVLHNPPDTEDGKAVREGVAAFEQGITDLELGIQPRYPNITFHDRMSLHLGDRTLELYDFAGLHSNTDICILVPGEHLILTGDMFWGGFLPVVRPRAGVDIPRLLENWRTVLAACGDSTMIITGHSDVPLSYEQFRDYHTYLDRVWTDVRAARSAGTDLETFLAGYGFEAHFPELAGTRSKAGEMDLHEMNIRACWDLAGR